MIDQSSTAEVRQYVSACKVLAAEVLHDIGTRTQHLHGALGVSNLMDQADMGASMAIIDGVSEIHKVAIARRVLKGYRPSDDIWPSTFRPRAVVNARRSFDALIERRIDDEDVRRDFGVLLESSPGRDEQIKKMEAYLEATIGNL
jgi:acyl-CoA dehydrogenase